VTLAGYSWVIWSRQDDPKRPNENEAAAALV